MSLDHSKLINLKKTSEGWTAQCPVCRLDGGDSKGVHLYIHRNGAYRCVKGGDDRSHSRAIYNILAGNTPSYEFVEYKPKLTVDQMFPEDSLSKLIPDYSYWVNRGVNPDILPAFGGGVAAEDEKSKLSGRYIFPCRDMRGTLIGFSGRALTDSTFAPKWKILGKKTRFIFPQPALAAKSPRLILTEGIGDVLALASRGIWNSLALFGVNLSAEQLGYMIAYDIREVIIATNNEESGVGNEAANSLKAKLSKFFNEENVRIHLPLAKDLLDQSSEQWDAWRGGL